MDQVIRGLSFVFVHTDDILTTGTGVHEYREHLRLVFQRFQEYGIFSNTSNSVLLHILLSFFVVTLSVKMFDHYTTRDYPAPESFKSPSLLECQLLLPIHTQLFRHVAATYRASREKIVQVLHGSRN